MQRGLPDHPVVDLLFDLKLGVWNKSIATPLPEPPATVVVHMARQREGHSLFGVSMTACGHFQAGVDHACNLLTVAVRHPLVPDIYTEPLDLDVPRGARRAQGVDMRPGPVADEPRGIAVFVDGNDRFAAVLGQRLAPDPLRDPVGYINVVLAGPAVESLDEVSILLTEPANPEADNARGVLVVKREGRFGQRGTGRHSLVDDSDLARGVVPRSVSHRLLRAVEHGPLVEFDPSRFFVVRDMQRTF